MVYRVFLIAADLDQLLDAAYAAGCTMWDTADIYGDSEELLGKWYVLLQEVAGSWAI